MKNVGRIVFTAWTVISCASFGSALAQPYPEAERNVQELVSALDSANRRYYLKDPKGNDLESLITKIIGLGSRAEKPLSFKLKHDPVLLVRAQRRLKDLEDRGVESWAEEFGRESVEVYRLSNNLELLTALRRIQKKPDPLVIRVIQPKGLTALTGKLPTFSVKLRSADVEMIPVWVKFGRSMHGSEREAQWRFEVKTTDGEILPVRESTRMFRPAGGVQPEDWLKHGDDIDTALPMGDFIEIPEPGEYSVTIQYHANLPIADITDAKELDGLIVFRSESFKLTVGHGTKRVVESTKSECEQVLSLIAELPNVGTIKVVGGVYDDDDFAFVQPGSPAGRILTLNWQAVPTLLDSLSDRNLTRHRKAWLLSLLYSITGERDLNPAYSGALPAFEVMAGKNSLGRDLSNDCRIIPREQDSLIRKWQEYRDQYLEIRESDAK